MPGHDSRDHGFPAERDALVRRLFPHGVPALWSPTLTFYDEAGRIDRERQLAHLAFMAPHVKGLLVPGSTGDAWEMDDDEALAALDLAIPFAAERGLDLLAGVLRPTTEATLALLHRLLERLGGDDLARPAVEAFAAARVRGITIAAPTSPEPMAQDAIGEALERVLGLGLPTAVYQLPQVTGNTIAPELLAGLAGRFPNLLMVKDSGGADEVALSGAIPEGVSLLRGAEGDYARWAKARGGPYDGFLLSTANAFPSQLARVLEDLDAGRTDEAERLSAAVSGAVAEAFAAVADLPQGNAFTNANKALAHVMAYGERASEAPPPRLHAGGHLPREVLTTAEEAIRRHGLMPERGYLEG